MLQYAWTYNDSLAEIQAYNSLAISYFNLSDMKNSSYYNEKGQQMILEEEESHTRVIACGDLRRINLQRKSERRIEIIQTTEPSAKAGKFCKRIHRAFMFFDTERQELTLADIEDFSSA